MPIEFETLEIMEDLKELKISLEAIDMESVKQRTVKRSAEAMAEIVRQAVVAEDDITSPAINSPYSRGDGPSMATLDAWIVSKDGPNRYTVSPHPSVEQRAFVLNYGYPGTITPDTADYLRFTIDGSPVYRKEVEGPDPTGYWQAAVRRINSNNKVRQIANDELEKEIPEALR